MDTFSHIGVIGAGAWGTALAQTLAHTASTQPQAARITLWAYEDTCAHTINHEHMNALYLPDIALNPSIQATSNIKDMLACELLLIVTPAQHMRSILSPIAKDIPNNHPIILCSKGIERRSLHLMSEVLSYIIPQSIAAVLSGPSFAIDVAKGLPTALTLACSDKDMGQKIQASIAAPTFRPYLTDDIIGAEIGGAVKNVLAIAAGMVLGQNLGRSAHAALISRGFAEMSRLGLAMGAKERTLTGLCGLGDLVLTCSSETSRNMSCGMALGRGERLEDILSRRQSVTEGVASAPAIIKLAQKYNVDMPICEAVQTILSGQENVRTAMQKLLSRAYKTEHSPHI